METTTVGTNKGRIEKTIAGYLRTGPDGKRLKMRFKIISLEIRPYTTADCVRRMYEDAWEELQRINALHNWLPPENLLQYDRLDMEKVLGVYVICRYRVVLPGGDILQEKTDTFVLSPNGEMVLGKEITSPSPM